MTDSKYMRMAVIAAKQARWHTWQNPRVGAVIVKDNQILAIGYHKKFGAVHAEIDAYEQIEDKQDLNGATIYVTLEPCAHQGKRPSCAKQMLTWGLERVVVGQIDPNPLVQHKGIAFLRGAGIRVDILSEHISEQINPAFHYFFTHKLPYVTLKIAQSANGKINAAVGETTKITTQTVDQDSHILRAYNQAIIVGSETALIDQPSLSVRYVKTAYQPLRVIVDRRGRLMGTDVNNDNTLIFTEKKQWLASNVVIQDPVTPKSILKVLAKRGIQSVLVEGGSQIHAAFLTERAYNEIIIYQTMNVLASSGQSSFAVTNETKLGEVTQVETIDNTLKIQIKREVS